MQKKTAKVNIYNQRLDYLLDERKTNSFMHLPERSGSRQEYYKLTYLRGDLTQELVRYLEMLCMGESYANHYRLALWEYINLLEKVGEAYDNLEFWRHFEKQDVEFVLKMAKLKRDHKGLLSTREFNGEPSKSGFKKDHTDSVHLSPHDIRKESKRLNLQSEPIESTLQDQDRSLSPNTSIPEGRFTLQKPKLHLRTKKFQEQQENLSKLKLT